MENIILPEVKNWKLREIIQYVKIVNEDSVKYEYELIQKLGLPTAKEYVGIIRGETHIDWNKMPKYYKFYLDKAGWEERIKNAFETSNLKNKKQLIITYGWKEPAVIIPIGLFFEDWEGFIASAHYETLMFSDDCELIMEVSRDYYLHSNFLIFSSPANKT